MTLRDAINAGYPQHAAIVFDGSLDIIGNERILVDNGFTLTQTYCAEGNLIPGSIASDHLVARLNNVDGALAGFDFERNCALLVGVEDGDPTVHTVEYSTWDDLDIFVNGQWFYIRPHPSTGVSTLWKRFDDGSGASVCEAENMFAMRGPSSTEYRLFVCGDVDGVKKITRVYKVNGYNDYEQDTDFTPLEISGYAWNRLEYLKVRRECELYDTRTGHTEETRNWKKFRVEASEVIGSFNVTETTVMLKLKAFLRGEHPKVTSGEEVEFTATTDFSTRLDLNADEFAKRNWSSGSMLVYTLGSIMNILTGMVTTWPSGSAWREVSFDTNPFYGITGLTYRDMISYIGQAAGIVVRFGGYLSTNYRSQARVPWFGVTFRCEASTTLSKGSTASLTLSRNEYYSYLAADYTVHPINAVEWQQVIPTSGVFGSDVLYPTEGGDLIYKILNNPIMDYNMQSGDGTLLSYCYEAVKENYFGNYRPCNFESHLGALINPGDTIGITLNDGTVAKAPVFVTTIYWNGSADCVVECTGVENYNQYNDPAFRAMLQEANQAYRIADNTGASSSSVNVKHDISRLTGESSGDIVDNLRPVTFRYNFDPDEKKHFGLIYEEVADRYPALVRPNPDDMKKRINYPELIPILLAEVQALRKRVKELEQDRN